MPEYHPAQQWYSLKLKAIEVDPFYDQLQLGCIDHREFEVLTFMPGFEFIQLKLFEDQKSAYQDRAVLDCVI